MENKVVIDKDLELSKKKLYDHIKSFEQEVNNREKSLVTNTHVHSLGWNDSFRLFLSKDISAAPALNKLLISSINSVNSTCPLALPLYFDTLINDKTYSLDSFHSRIGSGALLEGLKKSNDGFIQENIGVLSKALYEAGSTGCVSIKKLEANHYLPYVSTFDGFRTLCQLDSFFIPYLETTYIENCHIIPVCGAIIEVSEIHHILQEAYDSKRATIIIASSFSDDVANTLLVNWQQGKTNVIPFVLEDSLNAVNEIKDICSITGLVPISNDTGIRISSLDLSDYSNNTIFYDADSKTLRLMLDNESSLRIQRSRIQLQERLDKERVRDVIDILTERISRMSSRNVSLHIDFSDSERGLMEDRSAVFFTYFSRCAQQGVMRMDDGYPVKYLPKLEAIKAYRRAKKDREFIDSIKAIIELEP